MHIERPPFPIEQYKSLFRLFLPCVHLRAEPRRKFKTTGQPFYRIQCPDCGRALSSPLKFALVREDFEPTFGPTKNWDYQLEDAHWRRWSELRPRLRQVCEDWRSREWWRQYESYLHSSEWQAVRTKVMARANRLCERCRDRAAKHVHHLHYWNVGQELEEDLQAVCVPCHQELHPDRPLTAAL